MFDGIRNRLTERAGDGKVKVKKVRVTRRDIEENNLQIQASLDSLARDVRAISEEMSALDTKTESGRARYDELRTMLDDKNQVYSVFQKQLEQNYINLRKMTESGRTEIWMKGFVILGGIILSVIGLGLNRESPSILKMMDFILKPFRTPVRF